MHQLRSARIDELAQLTELCLQAKALCGYDDILMQDFRETVAFRPSDMEDSLICVAEGNNRLLGAAQLSLHEENAFLKRLFVAPTSLNNGIGKSLFGWSITTAHRAGARSLLIDCDPQAAGFYQRMGAREEAGLHPDALPGLRLPRFRVTLSSCRPSTPL